MGNVCCPLKKFRYTFISVHQQWYRTSHESSMLSSSCRVCRQHITGYSVVVKCNECKVIIGHADCIDTDKACMLCMR